MNTESVTKPPAMSAAQRQANKRERMRADIEAGKVARYQTESFRQLVTRAGALGITLEITPGLLPYEGALQTFNERALCLVVAEEKRRREARAASPESPYRPVVGVDADGVAIDAPGKPRRARKSPATVPPSKGTAKARKTRERVGK